MQLFGLDLPAYTQPELDPGFVPMGLFMRAHQRAAQVPFAIALQREEGLVSVFHCRLVGAAAAREADVFYLEQVIKCALWTFGGAGLTLCGDESIARAAARGFTQGGAYNTDVAFMETVYRRPFTVEYRPLEDCPPPREAPVALGRHWAGCRIGFDAGGSDRKVSAVIDGTPVFSQEVVWYPKQNADPDYHYNEILTAMETAAAHLPHVDAIGVSSAGVFIDGHCRVAQLFQLVPPERFKAEVEDIYLRAAAHFGNLPLAVANDGDVTALAGSMSSGRNAMLGLALGTGLAVGYVDAAGRLTGWLNELSYARVNAAPGAPFDPERESWGTGTMYLCQDAVIRLAGGLGIALPGATKAEQLKAAQARADAGEEKMQAVYRTVGQYLGHVLGLYSLFYPMENALVLGRVTSGAGGDIMLRAACAVLQADYPDCRFVPQMPDEAMRRVGQSVAAASLPELP